MADFKDVINTLDKAADGFGNIANAEQKKIYEEVVTLAKDLETDAQGKVKQTITNLKRLNQIKAKLAALSKDKEWVAGIGKFVKYFDILQKQQNAYFSTAFPQLTLGESAKKRNEMMKQIAVNNTIEALMGDGLKANVTDKLNDILLRGVTSGAKWADLQQELRDHLMGKEGGQGAFARYATTYATTALSQYTGQNNQMMTKDLGLEWFMYTGSNIETTREFCEVLTKKKWIHKSEIPTILKGKIEMPDGEVVEVAIYDKTGLPKGMIADTTPENFQCNCGGWNCRHQLIPVADAVVPSDVRARFKQIRPSAHKNETSEYEEWMRKNTLSVESAKYAAGMLKIDASVLDNKNATSKELDEALNKISKEIKTTTIIKRVSKKAKDLQQQGYKDVIFNEKGGLIAIHPRHAKHENDPKRLFKNENNGKGISGDELEMESVNELFRIGKEVILREEETKAPNGKTLRELDAYIDGKLMDIASITENNENTIKNILKRKHDQIKGFNETHQERSDSICIYFHNPSWYSKQKVLQQYEKYKKNARTIRINKIYVMLRGAEDLIEIIP